MICLCRDVFLGLSLSSLICMASLSDLCVADVVVKSNGHDYYYKQNMKCEVYLRPMYSLRNIYQQLYFITYLKSMIQHPTRFCKVNLLPKKL